MFVMKADMQSPENSNNRLETARTTSRMLQELRNCTLIDAGRVSYQSGLDLQKKARELVRKGERDGIVLLLEHEPVITFGANGGKENLLLEEGSLRSTGVALVKAERGGNITCHNPGQLVVYPVLNLKKWQQDVHWYVRTIEEVVIKTLATYQLHAEWKPGLAGVWLNDEKIAAIGIFVSRWIASHGLALNVNNDLNIFKSVVPCGIRCYGVTSLYESGVEVDVNVVKHVLIAEFENQFECELKDIGEIQSLSEQLLCSV